MKDRELLAGAEERIEKHRKAQATLKVLNARGRPVPDATVDVEQTRHAFLFGCNIFPLFEYQGEQHEQYGKQFAELFNYATLAFYWGAYEPEQGRPQAERNERIARWCQARGIVTKGHPLVWHEVYPRWAPTTREAVKPLLKERVRSIIKQFAGRIDIWDVVNEATVAQRFQNGIGDWARQEGAVEMVAECLAWAREANPKATLLYNDFNLSPAFEQLVEALVKRKAPIDAIGIQSHMHRGEWSLQQVWEVCETYAQFGLPLHFTEVTVLSGQHGWELPPPWRSTPEGELRQAEYVRKLYLLLFSHPAVQAITWWDFMDGGWQGAPAGLLRVDLSPKPTYERLKRLIRQTWWTKTTLRTNRQGQATLKGFLGDYRFKVRTTKGEHTQTCTLRKGANEWVIRLS